MKAEDQKRKDFIVDLLELASQYGYEGNDVLDILNAKPKTKEDQLLDQAMELYPNGTWFIPIGKNRARQSSGKVEILCDRVYAWQGLKMFKVYEPITNEWAKVINE
ncbi:MAG: hypothetical protein ACYC5G_04695 [Candidatus Doudnabacteria bacterium]